MEQTQLRAEAEALAIALEIGVVEVDEVIDWAEAQIAGDPAPTWALCEVALSRGKYPQDVVSPLRQIPGRFDPSNARSLVVQLIAHKLENDAARAYPMANALYQLALADELDDLELRRVAWWAWDALDLAASGYVAETCAQIVDQLRDALEKATEQTARRGLTWTRAWTPT